MDGQLERLESEARLMAALRATFDASVMNFGSYNILYAAGGGAVGDVGGRAGESADDAVQTQVCRAAHLLVGYRREPREMVLCPADLDEAVERARDGGDAVEQAPASVPLPVNLTNLAGIAAAGSRLEIALSTGRHVELDVRRAPRFPRLPGLGDVTIRQERDAADFEAFVDELMDTMESSQDTTSGGAVGSTGG
ncbi:hypothetical protein GCM10027060_06440 [Nesterenkonia halophila]